MSRNPAQEARVIEARGKVIEQLLFMERRGSTLDGYRRTFGDQAEAEYAKDRAVLHTAKSALDALLWTGPKVGQCEHGGRIEDCGILPEQQSNLIQ